MRIYFSGVGGVGMGPLMQIAKDAGYDVVGSDLKKSPMTAQLTNAGASVYVGQDGSQIASAHSDKSIDWFCYTAALPDNHPELVFVRENGIKATKRDELLAEIIREKNLKLIAFSGTHGKTTTTGLMIWVMRQHDLPVSYSVGTTISFGPSGKFDPASKYFVYECDEFDRNFLHFEPCLSVITSVDYDHFDTYPTLESYQKAFVQFIEQSGYSLMWEKDLRAFRQPDISASYEAYDELMDLSHITLAGDHVRHNAYLVEKAIKRIFPDIPTNKITDAINSFPGTSRRFEKLDEGLYTDYGHHPVEIAATLQLANEISKKIVLIYQPHQNIRQHEIRSQYADCMELAEQIYWLPTYLSREDPALEVLTPEQLSDNLTNKSAVVVADLNDELWRNIESARSVGKLVLVMGAGSVDEWVRSKLMN